MQQPLSFGIEEEYLLVDLRSARVLATPSLAVARRCREVMGKYFAEEMFRSQIEVASPVFTHLHEAQGFLLDSRQRLGKALAQEGVGLYCAASHPSAQWLRQRARTTPHYRQVFDDYQHVARRSLLSGLHVHVGVPPGCDRIQLINRLLYWLPLFLVLSTSSPLWGGQDTGFMSYRRVICAEWPHMELPEPLADWEAYQRYRALLERTGALAKEGDFWWAIRPSRRFPTVELRICDACPRLEDVLCIAGLFRHLVQGLAVDHYDATPVNREVRWITQENYWRAKRHGRHGQFIGVHDQAQVTAEGWLAQLLAQFPADTLDAQRAALEAQRILREGTSADRQLHCLEQARSGGRDVRQALHAVVDQVLAEGAQQSASNPVSG
ncbi:carboxylate-amine ligase [Pseudomonas guariconensis]|uniref:carboxylate-amine ligase n=1 Tax=Pseudomonas TaxID=286 RepID=UPI00209BB03C|nr:carboxylate-amine ligase [Pseudomonas guariconensis]MCO7622023.1 carboxylate-amine ligase [Pseudomonas guariconensis]MDM9594174.1 carboxylate-amine ligase [Pseudomonas guariconensis]MDM9607001.1 carboxylate-amine ligase [Pseudomonas guariconensis]MDM9611957.1 carboxylate-amine ligase [Pseudomonas guariconensis]MEB3841116.1 carboxylate-amine ligase [Pseudomonas guariconensis]